MDDIRTLEAAELTALLGELGEPAYRAGQLYTWLHRQLAESWEELSNLPRSLRDSLAGRYSLALPQTEQCYVSALDGTRKFLLRLADGHIIESVWMKYKHGNTVCISSQVGCRMGCRFCASTLDGLARNLSSAEMLGQIYRIQKETGERVSNVVIMGSGEPLDNYEELTRFIRMLSDERGLNISRRNITVSTCGLVPQIRRLADENYGVTLALSLHAPNDELRARLMPIARQYHLDEVLSAVRYYFECTGRRVSFEYSVVAGVNDTQEEAAALVRLLSRLRKGGAFQCHVNLIPVNPIKERDFKRPERRKLQDFKTVLERAGLNVTVRREMGADIAGACGQLRRSFIETPERAEEKA